ncbi:MAG: hypothetical protein PHO07_00985 [Pirellulales bacterium]|nr:hypothetical protein [Pirellulales bacterium]
MRKSLLAASLALILCFWGLAPGDEGPVGKRPYEMDWAGRNEPPRPALVDFENLDGWTVACQQAAATLSRSRQQQLWGTYVGKLTYRADGGGPKLALRPPAPIPLSVPGDSVSLWVYGNNWAYSSDPTTPQVSITVVLRSAPAADGTAGAPVRVELGRVRWKEWFWMHRRLTPEQQQRIGPGATFDSIEIGGGSNREDRELFFDDLCFYREELKPLRVEPQPQRGVGLFEGQSPGVHSGPGRLPFPTREETILPDNAVAEFRAKTGRDGSAYTFTYEGSDGRLTYRYTPRGGDLGDIEVIAPGELRFRPMVDGGFLFQTAGGAGAAVPEKAELVECRQDGDLVTSRWRYRWGAESAEGTLRLRLWQKSLVVDLACPGGAVGEVRTGRAVGLKQVQLVSVPYLTCDARRPAVLVSTDGARPLFMMGLFDHCRTNASEFFAINDAGEKGAVYHGGTRYRPKTDGARNDCFERLFLTVAPTFEEVLPNIPNPKSPWMDVTGTRLWRAHGASNRQADYLFWQRVARFGMTEMVVTDHEVGWRDGGESFTLRTRAAPGKGGDAGQAEYARKMRALGIRYGIYNNYRDFAPVNEHWDPDRVGRDSLGQLIPAWARCYMLKPTAAVELEARLAPIIQEKFQLDTSYCDVHTAVTPWSSVDYDARAPGAGRAADVFYAYGQIMLHQKKTWNGPVYSEGNQHWYYCGLTDGNYGQDQGARLAENPWLVDFDLRKLHPLCCNFGMGNPGMFFGREELRRTTAEDWPAKLDQFLAATLAFGHTGFFVREAGEAESIRSYFSIQQLHTRYARDTVATIRYADQAGKLLDTSTAVATGAFRRSQIKTVYRGGMEVWVNGHREESWTIPGADRASRVVLPPHGWYAIDRHGKDLVGFSALVDGHRADYVDGPAYTYANGRGRFTRFDRAACDGQLIAHRRAGGSVELIPVGCRVGFAVDIGGAAAAVALDEAGKEIGPADTRFSRGLVHVVPVEGAFSYLLSPRPAPPEPLGSKRTEAIPGEQVEVGGGQPPVRCPTDAPIGRLFWHCQGGRWLDFLTVPLVDAAAALEESRLAVTLRSRLADVSTAKIRLADKRWEQALPPATPVRFDYPLAPPADERVEPVELIVEAAALEHRQMWWLKTEERIAEAARWPEWSRFGQRLRSGEEDADLARTRAHVHHSDRLACGGSERDGWAMHPPYVGGTGCVFALTEAVKLPETAAVLKCEIGKGDGSDRGDGILFQIAVVAADGTETLAAERVWDEHAWSEWTVDLGRWAGQKVQLKAIADVGKNDNSSGDWARWANLRLETAAPVPVRTLHDRPAILTHANHAETPPQVDLAQLRKGTGGRVCLESIGLEKSGRYTSYAALNGAALGPLPPSRGSESTGQWGPETCLPLTAEAIATLGRENVLAISNPGQDCFKVRRVRIELNLPAGGRISSQINTTVWTQPPEWLHAEGVLVPFGKEIEAAVRFRAAGGKSGDE